VILVGDSAGADHRTIHAALDAVNQPHTTIRLEPGIYSGSLHIKHRDELEGLTIEPDGPVSRGAVVLRSEAPHDATITIEDVAHVTLRRLTFDSLPNQFALAVKGSAPGLTVEEIAFRKRPVEDPEDIWSHVWLGRGAHGEPGQPIRFRRCAFAPWRANLVLQGEHHREAIAHVEIDACRFDGGTRLVELIEAVHDIRVHGCLFLGGTHGVYLDRLAGSSRNLDIDHNTFFRTEHWVRSVDCDPDLDAITITANALLEINAFDATGAPLTACRDGGWTLTDNLAEGSPTAVGHKLVTLQTRLEVASRDVTSPDFLRPLPGSALLAPESPDAGGLIGALRPVRVRDDIAAHAR
jgi:hypothetical protein